MVIQHKVVISETIYMNNKNGLIRLGLYISLFRYNNNNLRKGAYQFEGRAGKELEEGKGRRKVI